MSEVDTSQGATQTGAENSDDAAAVAAALTEGGGQGGEENQGWMLAEGVNGEGETPEWFKGDKYGTVVDQAKAYKELESRFGSFTGSPEEYAVNLSEELTERGIEIGTDDPLYEEALSFAKDSNMSQEGFDKMMNLYATSKVAEGEALELHKQAEIASLGDNAQARIDNLTNWGKANLPADLFDGFQEMATSANAVRAMEKLISMSRNAPISPESVKAQSGITAEEVQKMQFEKDEYGNRRLQTDPAFRAKFNKLKEQVWGSEEYRNIIGN